MTFTEAAIEVLRREGKPLHFKKIAEIAVRESLLDHVGKIPEEVMGGQLVDHCRLPHSERRVLPVQPGTFALVEWGLDEDPTGLENLLEPPPEGDLAYRPRERHPVPSREIARTVGRGAEQRARRREEGEERRAKRFPPPADVAFEILAGSDRPLSLTEIAGRGAERLLMPDAFVRDAAALAAALAEDNRRREASGKKPLFGLDGDVVTLVAQPEPGEAPLAAAPVRAAPPVAAPGDVRRAGLAALRRRLRECDAPTVEHVTAQLLEKLGFREVKVAKRGREHVVYTARKRMGLADVRHGVRILRTGGEVTRRDVSDLRRDLSNYGAQIGVVVSTGDAARDARGEASAPGQLPVLLVCGDAFAEAMVEAALGCQLVVVPEVDDAFFRAAAEAAALEESARKARREERDRRDPDRAERREARRDRGAARGAEPAAEAAGSPPAPEPVQEGAIDVEVRGEPQPPPAASARGPAAAEPAEVAAGDDDEGDEEGDEGEDGEEIQGQVASVEPGERPGAVEGEPRRRRRRRRRRGGRGRGERREGGGASATAPAGEATPGGERPVPSGGDAAASVAPPAAPASTPMPPPLPPLEPPSGGGGEEPR